MNAPECILKLTLKCQVIESVKRANAGIHSTVKLERRHVLTKIQYLFVSFDLIRSVLRYHQHLVRKVYTRHIVSASVKLLGHLSRSAGKIEDKLGTLIHIFIKAALVKISERRIINDLVYIVIYIRKSRIAFHHFHFLL